MFSTFLQMCFKNNVHSLLLGITILFAEFANCQYAPELVWQRSYGGSDSDAPEKVITTHDNGYLIVGGSRSSDGDVSTHFSTTDYWVLRLDSIGDILWEVSLGGSMIDKAYSALEDTDGNFVVVGESRSGGTGLVSTALGLIDFWVVKVDASGNMLWEKSFGGSGHDFGHDIVECADGGYMLVGTTMSTDQFVTNSISSQDIWLCKISPSGIYVWDRSLGGSLGDIGYSICMVEQNRFVIAGSSWSSDVHVPSNQGVDDAFIICVDSLGNVLWSNSWGGSNIDYANAVAPATDMGVVVVGKTYSSDGDATGQMGQGDGWIALYDSIGALQWQKHIGGSSGDELHDVILLPDGTYMFVGETRSTAQHVSDPRGDKDVCIGVVDENGDLIWFKNLGGSNIDFGTGCVVSNNGRVTFASRTISTDWDISDSHGNYDYWLGQLSMDYAWIQGESFFDLNGNSSWDLNEPPAANRLIRNMTSQFSYFTRNDGSFMVPATNTGTTVVQASQPPNFVPFPSSQSINFSSLNQQVDSINDFAFQAQNSIDDLCISVIPNSAFRPGFSCSYTLDYANVGTTLLNATIVMSPDPILTYSASTLPPGTIAPTSITWIISSLPPLSSGQIVVSFTLPPSATLGSMVNSQVSITSTAIDANPHNNDANWTSLITGSYDPNDILVNRHRMDPSEFPDPPPLEYIIRFQNTGTDTAFNVRVENPVPPNIDLSSFQLQSSSHPVQVSYMNHSDKLVFMHENILLPDSTTDQANSHGFIRYSVRPLNTLSLGDSVLNHAGIYFDFNEPIITNTAVTSIEHSLNVIESTLPSIQLYPNPTSDQIHVDVQDGAEWLLYDKTGRLLRRGISNSSKLSLSMSDEPNGQYILRIIDTEVFNLRFTVVH